MEQVFEMSNKLLSRDRKAKARDLCFRTYVVIPLARKTGVLEFVGNSQGIGDWLKPAHLKYGKLYDDHPAETIRKTLKPLQEDEGTWPQLKGEYQKLMLKFHPVMRFFFHEKHRDAMAWFGMRLNYARSVAVTSVVGWVLGIGDRHCSNILIDTKSGELVHVDFGIVFEEVSSLIFVERSR
jgi:ataxia telangiectasia mutated family protein